MNTSHDLSHPFKEVYVMIAHALQDAFNPEWINTHVPDPTNELITLRHIIPWQAIIDRLVPFYDTQKGRTGQPLRTMVATSLIARLRQFSDRRVIKEIKENRYIQYFCNVPDAILKTCMHPTTLSSFRKRLGTQGIAIIEEEVFKHFKNAHVIEADMMLQDSTVLQSPIIYPTDVRLLYKAFDKMACIAKQAKIELWWDQSQIKKLWRAYHLDKSKPLAYLCAFYLLFEPALETFATHQHGLPEGGLKTQAQQLLDALLILDEQTQLKLEGQRSIPHRLVSLDDLDARPIQKGKRHPKTEFGTMLQLSFNRQGFMITAENFIGKPNDKTLYGATFDQYVKRMQGLPKGTVTDSGFRSDQNLKCHAEDLDFVFMGKSTDVDEAHQAACLSARSATEGFIAVAKNLRGFGQSLYRGLKGATMWTLLNQCAYNLKKFLQLYHQELLSEETRSALRL